MVASKSDHFHYLSIIKTPFYKTASSLLYQKTKQNKGTFTARIIYFKTDATRSKMLENSW